MSKDWWRDLTDLHLKYGFHPHVDGMSGDELKQFLEFRIKFLEEEMRELKTATCADDVVDALIDLCVVAIGTLDLFDVEAHEAWDRVHEANMAKEKGIKASRPNPFGFPDLIKPSGWRGPEHNDNLGYLSKIDWEDPNDVREALDKEEVPE